MAQPEAKRAHRVLLKFDDQHNILYGGKLLDESKSLDQYGIKNFKHDTGSSSPGNSCYSNLNLNQNHKCLNASLVQSHSIPLRNKQNHGKKSAAITG
jgi:hypothetical protein